MMSTQLASVDLPILDSAARWADANPLVVAILMIAFLAVAVFPTIVAFARRLADRRKIAIMNAAGIVVFAFWLGALTWAILGKEDVSAYEKVERWRYHILGGASIIAAIYLIVLFKLST